MNLDRHHHIWMNDDEGWRGVVVGHGAAGIGGPSAGFNGRNSAGHGEGAMEMVPRCDLGGGARRASRRIVGVGTTL